MNIIELIKEKTLWLIGAVLITIPLMACYPILLYLGLSQRISTIATVLLSGIAYILLVTRIEPVLRRVLPFIRTKAQDEFSAIVLKHSGPGLQIIKGPSSHLSDSELGLTFSNTNILKDLRGNWTHS